MGEAVARDSERTGTFAILILERGRGPMHETSVVRTDQEEVTHLVSKFSPGMEMKRLDGLRRLDCFFFSGAVM